MSHSYNTYNLAVWSVSKTKAGKVKTVKEYVDWTTGEIIPTADAGVTVVDRRELSSKREATLSSLRPEVREFATFVLEYRNNRRGITPGINTLCIWYADLMGKRSDNVKRYIPKLEAAGILVNEQVVGPLFQRKRSIGHTVLRSVDGLTRRAWPHRGDRRSIGNVPRRYQESRAGSAPARC